MFRPNYRNSALVIAASTAAAVLSACSAAPDNPPPPFPSATASTPNPHPEFATGKTADDRGDIAYSMFAPDENGSYPMLVTAPVIVNTLYGPEPAYLEFEAGDQQKTADIKAYCGKVGELLLNITWIMPHNSVTTRYYRMGSSMACAASSDGIMETDWPGLVADLDLCVPDYINADGDYLVDVHQTR